MLEKFGFVFESDTDTEAVAKLAKYIYDTQKKCMGAELTFTNLVKAVCKELVYLPFRVHNRLLISGRRVHSR